MNKTGITLISVLLVLIAFLGFQQYRATSQVRAVVTQISEQDNGLVIDRGEAELWNGRVVLKEIRFADTKQNASFRKAEFELGFTDMVRLAFFGPKALLNQMRGVEIRLKEVRVQRNEDSFSAKEVQFELYGLKNLQKTAQQMLRDEVPASDARFVLKGEELYVQSEAIPDFIKIPRLELSGNLNYLQKAVQIDKFLVHDGTSQNRIEGIGFIPLQHGPLSEAWKFARFSIIKGNWDHVMIPVSEQVGEAEFKNLSFTAEIDQFYPISAIKKMKFSTRADSIIIHPPEPLTMPYQPLVAFVGYSGSPLPGSLLEVDLNYSRETPFRYKLNFSTEVADISAGGQIAINLKMPSESLFAGINDVSVNNIDPGVVQTIKQIASFFGKNIPIQENTIQLQMYGKVTNPGFSRK
jgi:hypothetical protein